MTAFAHWSQEQKQLHIALLAGNSISHEVNASTQCTEPHHFIQFAPTMCSVNHKYSTETNDV
jgi:hypothetical protein